MGLSIMFSMRFPAIADGMTFPAPEAVQPGMPSTVLIPRRWAPSPALRRGALTVGGLGLVLLLFAALIVYDVRLALFFGAVVAATPPLLYLAITNTALPVQLALVLMPLLYSPILNPPLLGISGMKPWTLLAAAACGVALFDRRLYAIRGRIDVVATRLFFLYLAVWIIVFFRAVPNVGLFHAIAPTKFPPSPTYFFFKDFAVPFLYTFFFFIILKMARSETAIRSFLRVIGLSMFVFSMAILAVAAIEFGALTGSRGAWSTALERYLGLGYNTAGTVYIITAPLLLYLALTRRLFWVANFALSLTVILLLQSRSSLLVYALSCAAMLVLNRRLGLLVAAGAVGVIVLAMFIGYGMPLSIEAVVAVGIEDAGGSWSMNSLLADRLALLWAPLLDQWFSEPLRLLFGAGRYGIMTSDVYVRGAYFLGTHPHNALIEVLLDAGIVVAAAMLFAIIYFLRRGWKLGRRLDDPLFWALYCAIGGYLVASLTERSFFPSYDNFELFPVLALLVCTARLRLSEAGEESAEPLPVPTREPPPAAARPRAGLARPAGRPAPRLVPRRRAAPDHPGQRQVRGP